MARQVLTLPDVPATLLTQAAGDARYQPVGAYLTQATADVRYLQLTGGSVLTGLLGPTTTNTRDLGTSALRWRKLWTTDIDASNQINALYMTISGASATARRLYFQSSTINRWRVGATATAEGGSNAGTDFAIGRFSDAAADLGDALTITRATGNATFGGNLGVGVAPAAWGATYRAVQVGQRGAVWADSAGPSLWLSENTYFDGTDRRAIINAAASQVTLANGGFLVGTAPVVAAGAIQTYTTRLTMDQAGNAGLGATPSAWHPARIALQLGGAAALTGNAGSLGTQWSENNYLDASVVDRAIMTGVSTKLSLGYVAGALTFSNAPSVAAGAAQTFTTRLSVGATGTTTLTPDAATAALVFGNGRLQDSGNPEVYTAGAQMYFGRKASYTYLYGNSVIVGAAGGGAMYPDADGAYVFGLPGSRWATMYSTVGAINTSHVSTKENFAALDSASCAEAVLGTDWLSFDYKAPPAPEPAPIPEGETEEEAAVREEVEAARQQQWAESEEAGRIARHQNGYVLGSGEYQTADLFGLSDRTSANVNSDLAVVACALQHCLLEIAELKARLA